LNDISLLHLPASYQAQVEHIITANRFQWEPWIESAATWRDLQLQILKRGFGSVPVTDKPELLSPPNGVDMQRILQLPNQKTMLRRRSQKR